MSVTAPEEHAATQPPARGVVELVQSRRALEICGAVVSLLVGVGLFSRFSIDGNLSRDESIYAYGGQQLVHGVAPYASIFDPKGPGATFLAGLAAWLGHLVGHDELKLIRLAFFACAVLTVVAVYLLALQLWGSISGALVAAAVFSAYKGFAEDALAGPDAKTPGILCAVLAMWLAARRQWAWAALLGSLATLVWQPLGFYPLAALLGALVCTTSGRIRAFGLAFAAAAGPWIVVSIYFAAEGAFGEFIDAAFRFPASGLQQGHETVWQRIKHIASVVHHGYGRSGMVLFWGGLVLLLLIMLGTAAVQRAGWGASLRAPLVLVVLFTLLGEAAFASSNFQGNPDLFPLLPYAALGFGGTVALATRAGARAPARVAALRFAAPAVASCAALALVVWTAQWYTNAPENERGLRVERAMGCVVKKLVVPGTPLYSLGSPVPLVMTGRANPDRYIYLESGVDQWKVRHTKGGFDAWMAQIRDSHASVVVLLGWHRAMSFRAWHWLVTVGGYTTGTVGQWRVFLNPAALARAHAAGIALRRYTTKWPVTAAGTYIKHQYCVGGS